MTEDGYRETWHPGERAHFEYHCLESDDSKDAAIWHASHQVVMVLGRGNDDTPAGTMLADRADMGQPKVYRVRHDSGFEHDAFEDELLTGPQFYERPEPPHATTGRQS